MTERRWRTARLLACLVAFACVWALAPARAFALDSEPYVEEATAAILCDQEGHVLWERNADLELAPASITKIMTAMVALDAGIDLDDTWPIVVPDISAEAQRAGYTSDDAPTLRELMLVTLVYSGNDAAYNVACAVAGSEEAFCDLMNAKAAEIGMTHTHFANSHGLEEDGHYSCARDLVVMGRYALTHYPFIAQAVQMDGVEATVGDTTYYLESTDELMGSYEGLLGIKTGMVASGTAFLGASMRGHVALYTCVLGCDTDEGRFIDTASLMDWAYETYLTDPVGAGWTVRVAPYALGFSTRCRVRASAEGSLAVWPEGQLTTGGTTLVGGAVLAEPGDALGATWWRQDGRFAGGQSYVAGNPEAQVPAVNAFALPLFEDAA